jgi:hypothetical protein
MHPAPLRPGDVDDPPLALALDELDPDHPLAPQPKQARE